MTHGTLRRNKNGIIRKLEIRRMAKVKKQRDVIKKKLGQKGYSKGYQHSRTHKPDESYGENSQQADMCREMYEKEEKEFIRNRSLPVRFG
jgi:bifunctional DNA-binding transcriptional regulator/antitoxin component of YhaV-PrlF toxin-antitoxin module